MIVPVEHASLTELLHNGTIEGEKKSQAAFTASSDFKLYLAVRKVVAD